MINTIVNSITAPLIAFFMLLTGQTQAPVNVGAALPSATAVFETSLASPITSSATTFTLASNSVRGGGSLSGFNCFSIDEGSAQAETVCGTVSGTTVSSVTRGISQSTGTTTVAALQFSHRRGANVKITDFPLIQILKAQNNGEDTFENPLVYDSGVSTAELAVNGQNVASVAYANSLAFGAIPAASETASGFVELSTQTEAASSTSSGSAARLVLPASIATSTYNQATAPLRVVVTKNDGTIDQGFMPGTTTKALGFATSTYIGSTYAFDIGKNRQVITSDTTWIVPSGINKVFVTAVGGGGGSLGCITSSYCTGEGGAGGGFAQGIVDVSATTSIKIEVGPGGIGGPNGASCVNASTTRFSTYLTATGGNSCTTGGGTGTGGDINITGSNSTQNSVSSVSCFQTGGATPFTIPYMRIAGSGTGGFQMTGFGSGAAGGCEYSNDNSGNGGANGQKGVVIISW